MFFGGSMTKEIHGGDIWRYNGKMLDFSANINPLGMPDSVKKAAIYGVDQSEVYPDPHCTMLRKTISETQSVPIEWCVCGNGAVELLDRLMMALRPKCGMICPPTFGEYERSLKAAECQVVYHYLKKKYDFDVTKRLIHQIRTGLDILILCNPNNPTGKVIPADLMTEILKKCHQCGVRLLVDESFLDLTDEDYTYDMTSFLSKYHNLFLLRSMTKNYAIPGLRLGYLLSADTDILDKMYSCGQPWSVSIPAQFAGIAALRDCGEWCSQGRKLIQNQRKRLIVELKKRDFFVYEGCANYLLIYKKNTSDLREKLLEYCILIRSCESFRGLGADYYRIAIRTEEENTRFLNTLDDILNKEGEQLWQSQL